MLAFSIFAVLAASAASVNAAVQPSLNNTVEKGMRTECKTCPYTLCTNKAYYEGEEVVTLTCYTHGTSIDGDDVWLRTTDGCYVTQYDLTEYNGTYEDDLKYCGAASEVEHLTKKPAKTKYNTECNIIPQINSDTVSTWLKTTSNCYVAQIGLTRPANKAGLDYCGPIPFLEVNKTSTADPEIEPEVERRFSTTGRKRKAKTAPANSLNKRYLVNFTVGEDYAYCHSCAKSSCSTVKRYEWDTSVWLQCSERTESTNPNETYWLLTTDFCWVREVDFWESIYDQYKYPRCSLFG